MPEHRLCYKYSSMTFIVPNKSKLQKMLLFERDKHTNIILPFLLYTQLILFISSDTTQAYPAIYPIADTALLGFMKRMRFHAFCLSCFSRRFSSCLSM